MEKSVNTNIKSKQISLHNQTWGEWEWRDWIALSCSDYSSDHKNYNFLMIVIDLKNPISHLLAKLLSDSSTSQSDSMLSFKSTSHNLGFNHHSNSVKYVRFSESIIFVRFCYHLYDYKSNWTPISPITITNYI